MATNNIRPIWTPDDFDQAVRDAQAVVEAGRYRRPHLKLVVPQSSRLFSVSRERRARLYDGLAVALLMALMAALGAVLFFASAPHAKADSDAGCAEQFWMWKGLRPATRVICDSPRNADGSWTRRRGFFANAYTTNAYSSCYRYGCTYYPARYVPELSVIDEYQVTDATVLPDEPGWIQ